jgi:hypothetical protein
MTTYAVVCIGCAEHITEMELESGRTMKCKTCNHDYCEDCVRSLGLRDADDDVLATCPWCTRDKEKKTPLVGRASVHVALLLIDDELGLENDPKGQDILMKVRERIRKYEEGWTAEGQPKKKRQKKTDKDVAK